MEALTLESIRSEADGVAYPRHLLAECDDALVLFAAGFLGRQDAFWIADAGLRATCVDARYELLEQMAQVYPAGWAFLCRDIYEHAAPKGKALIAFGRADVVSVDCPSGHFARCAELADTWCALARKYVVLGAGPLTQVEAPAGWQILERRHRSRLADWVVLGRA